MQLKKKESIISAQQYLIMISEPSFTWIISEATHAVVYSSVFRQFSITVNHMTS